MIKTLHLFDLDHTLLSINGSCSFGSFLFKKKYCRKSAFAFCLFSYTLHKLGLISLEQIHELIFKKLFFGRSSSEVEGLAKDFLDASLKEMLYMPALARLRDAQKHLEEVAILSSSPQFLVKPIAERLNVLRWDSSFYATDAGKRYSNIGKIIAGGSKARYLQGLSLELGIPKEHITVYSDSYLDRPLFGLAGTVVAVNPDRRLKRLSKIRQWEII